MQDTRIPLFERDPDQSGAPTGTIAYLLRWWGTIYTGVVSKVGVVNNLPALTYIAHDEVEATGRPAKFPAEVSRVFVSEDAEIDPAVFTIAAPPLPNDVPPSL